MKSARMVRSRLERTVSIYVSCLRTRSRVAACDPTRMVLQHEGLWETRADGGSAVGSHMEVLDPWAVLRDGRSHKASPLAR